MPFYFESTYVVGDGEGEGGVRGTNEAFKRSADHSYIMYGLSLSNDHKNSEVKQAIAQYYRQNNLQPVNDETLSKYFKQKHPSFTAGTIRFP